MAWAKQVEPDLAQEVLETVREGLETMSDNLERDTRTLHEILALARRQAKRKTKSLGGTHYASDSLERLAQRLGVQET